MAKVKLEKIKRQGKKTTVKFCKLKTRPRGLRWFKLVR